MTSVAYKRLDYKKRANSNLVSDRSSFLANKTEACIRSICVKYYSDKFLSETKLQNCLIRVT